jgi:hypothetical protein
MRGLCLMGKVWLPARSRARHRKDRVQKADQGAQPWRGPEVGRIHDVDARPRCGMSGEQHAQALGFDGRRRQRRDDLRDAGSPINSRTLLLVSTPPRKLLSSARSCAS